MDEAWLEEFKAAVAIVCRECVLAFELPSENLVVCNGCPVRGTAQALLRGKPSEDEADG